MNINLGNLQFASAKVHPELMSPVVADAIVKLPGGEKIGVTEIDPSLSDTVAFCEKYGVGREKAANCVILEAKRSDKTWFAACVIFGDTRADVNGVVRKTLNARRVSFAPMEKAVSESSMEYGAITPVGLPDTWSIIVDQAVVDCEYVIIGSGIRQSKLAIPGYLFSSLPNVQVLEGVANKF